jgi:hypothetical protein
MTWDVGARFTVEAGPAPEPLLGAAVLAGGGRTGWMLRATLGWAASRRESTQAGNARFRMLSARLDGCPLEWRLDVLALRPCAALELGTLLAEGLDPIARPRDAAESWVAFGPGTRGELALGPAFVELEPMALVPLTRRTWIFENPYVEIHETPGVAWALAAGAGLRFR